MNKENIDKLINSILIESTPLGNVIFLEKNLKIVVGSLDKTSAKKQKIH